MKKTPWFPYHVKPVRAGLYEVKRLYSDDTEMRPHMLYWNGSSWRYAYRFGCAIKGDFASVSSGDYWRGLTRSAA